jgi:hypothetical protein
MEREEYKKMVNTFLAKKIKTESALLTVASPMFKGFIKLYFPEHCGI